MYALYFYYSIVHVTKLIWFCVDFNDFQISVTDSIGLYGLHTTLVGGLYLFGVESNLPFIVGATVTPVHGCLLLPCDSWIDQG